MGYYRAGFDVVGVDREPKRRYPFPFVQMDCIDAMEILLAGWCIVATDGRRYFLRDFVAVVGSPPCQVHSALAHLAAPGKHVDMIPQTRDAMRATGLPYVIENVERCQVLINPVTLCATMFGLRTKCGAELQRHRKFEANWPLVCDLECNHYNARRRRVIGVYGHEATDTKKFAPRGTITVVGKTAELSDWDRTRPHRVICVAGDTPHDPKTWRAEKRGMGRTISVAGNTPQRETFSIEDARDAMGIHWMTMAGLSQAIPPDYTEYIGRRLMEYICRRER